MPANEGSQEKLTWGDYRYEIINNSSVAMLAESAGSGYWRFLRPGERYVVRLKGSQPNPKRLVIKSADWSTHLAEMENVKVNGKWNLGEYNNVITFLDGNRVEVIHPPNSENKL